MEITDEVLNFIIDGGARKSVDVVMQSQPLRKNLRAPPKNNEQRTLWLMEFNIPGVTEKGTHA